MRLRENFTVILPRKKGIHPTCKECKKLYAAKYVKCLGPCNWLVSAICNEARSAAIDATHKKSWR